LPESLPKRLVLDGFMITAPSLIPELDDIVRRGDPARRADAARRISELFFKGPRAFAPITSICSTAS
jgi:hypothetical protein